MRQGEINPLTEAFTSGDAYKRELLSLEGGVLSAAQFAARLGISSEEVRGRRDRNEIFFLRVEDEDVFPAFQVGPAGLLPGASEVLVAFAVGDPWMRVNFMLTGDARLGGMRPIDVLRAGRVSEAVRAARAYGIHGAA